MNFNFKPAAAAAPAPVSTSLPHGMSQEEFNAINENGWSLMKASSDNANRAYTSGRAFASAVDFSERWHKCEITSAALLSAVRGLNKIQRGAVSYHEGTVKSVNSKGDVTLEDGTLVRKGKIATTPTEGQTLKFQTISFSADTFDAVRGSEGYYFRYFQSAISFSTYTDKMATYGQ